jgi:hypothetical protein
MKATVRVKEVAIPDRYDPCEGCIFYMKHKKYPKKRCFAETKLSDLCFWNNTIWVFKGKGE